MPSKFFEYKLRTKVLEYFAKELQENFSSESNFKFLPNDLFVLKPSFWTDWLIVAFYKLEEINLTLNAKIKEISFKDGLKSEEMFIDRLRLLGRSEEFQNAIKLIKFGWMIHAVHLPELQLEDWAFCSDIPGLVLKHLGFKKTAALSALEDLAFSEGDKVIKLLRFSKFLNSLLFWHLVFNIEEINLDSSFDPVNFSRFYEIKRFLMEVKRILFTKMRGKGYRRHPLVGIADIYETLNTLIFEKASNEDWAICEYVIKEVAKLVFPENASKQIQIMRLFNTIIKEEVKYDIFDDSCSTLSDTLLNQTLDFPI